MQMQFVTKIEPESRVTNDGLEIEKRLNSPVLLEEWLPNYNDVIKAVKKVMYK